MLSSGLDFQISERFDSLAPRNSAILGLLNTVEGIGIVDVVLIQFKLIIQE